MKSYLKQIEKAFNGFDGKNVEKLNDFYADEVEFHDPIVNIKGLPELKKYYAHAYKNVKSIHFDFKDVVDHAPKCAATWEMKMAVKGLNGGRAYVVHGISHLHFNDEGKVIYHRDYLDLGEMLYEKLPLQGFVIRSIKKLLAKT